MASFFSLQQKLKEATNNNEFKNIFYNMDQILKADRIKLPDFQGDEVIQTVITFIQNNANLNVDEYTLCKSLIVHSVLHPNFVSIKQMQQLYKFTFISIIETDPTDWRFDKYMSIMIDIFLKIKIHKFDPRKDQQDVVMHNNKKHRLSTIYSKVQQIFKIKPYKLLHEQSLLLINTINYECPQIIVSYWDQYFGNKSVVGISLQQHDNETLLKEAIKVVYQACKAAKNQLKLAQLPDKLLSCYLTSHNQAEALQQTLNLVQQLYKSQYETHFNDYMQKLLNQAFLFLLKIINYSNMRFNAKYFVQFCNLSQQNELMLYNTIFNQLKEDIHQLSNFNQFRIGQYYKQFFDQFNMQLRDSVLLLIKYYKNIDKLADLPSVNTSNRFCMLDDDQEEDLTDVRNFQYIELNIKFVSNYLAVFPIIDQLVEMFPFIEVLKMFVIIDNHQEKNSDAEQDTGTSNTQTGQTPIQQSDTSVFKVLINLMLTTISQGSKNIQQQNMQFLSYFTQQYQYGINMCLGQLSQVDDENDDDIIQQQTKKRSANYDFLQYYCNQLLGKQIKPMSDQFLTTALNIVYQDFILKSILIQSEKRTTESTFFISLFHVPLQFLNNLENDQFLQLYNLTLKEINYFKAKKLTNQLQYQFSRVLYAHQLLLKTDQHKENALIQQETIKLLTDMILQLRISPNNKKPILQSIGCVVQNKQYQVTNEIIQCITQESEKVSRCQGTALRVLGFLIERMDSQLQLNDYQIEDLVNILIKSVNEQKDQTSFAAVVVLSHFYTKMETINNAIIDDKQKEIFCKRTQQIHEDIKQTLADKTEEMLRLYSRASENAFRCFQIKKYLVQTMNTLGDVPGFLISKTTFNLVKYQFNQFIKLFKQQESVLDEVNKLVLWVVFSVNKFKFIVEKDSLLYQYIQQYLQKQIEIRQQLVIQFKQQIKQYQEDDDEKQTIEKQIVEIQQETENLLNLQQQYQ